MRRETERTICGNHFSPSWYSHHKAWWQCLSLMNHIDDASCDIVDSMANGEPRGLPACFILQELHLYRSNDSHTWSPIVSLDDISSGV